VFVEPLGVSPATDTGQHLQSWFPLFEFLQLIEVALETRTPSLFLVATYCPLRSWLLDVTPRVVEHTLSRRRVDEGVVDPVYLLDGSVAQLVLPHVDLPVAEVDRHQVLLLLVPAGELLVA